MEPRWNSVVLFCSLAALSSITSSLSVSSIRGLGTSQRIAIPLENVGERYAVRAMLWNQDASNATSNSSSGSTTTHAALLLLDTAATGLIWINDTPRASSNELILAVGGTAASSTLRLAVSLQARGDNASGGDAAGDAAGAAPMLPSEICAITGFVGSASNASNASASSQQQRDVLLLSGVLGLVQYPPLSRTTAAGGTAETFTSSIRCGACNAGYAALTPFTLGR